MGKEVGLFSQQEGNQFYLFKELLKNVNHLERLKDGHDHSTEKIIFQGRNEAFEMYRAKFYKDVRLREAANDIIAQEKKTSELIIEGHTNELQAMWNWIPVKDQKIAKK